MTDPAALLREARDWIAQRTLDRTLVSRIDAYLADPGHVLAVGAECVGYCTKVTLKGVAHQGVTWHCRCGARSPGEASDESIMEAAKRLGVRPSTLSDIEHGKEPK